MVVKFDNQYHIYPIVLIPDKIRNQIQSDIDEDVIALELGIKRPQKLKIQKPQPPSKYYYKESSEIKLNYTVKDITFLFFIFIGSICIGNSFSNSFDEGIKITIFAFIGWSLFYIIFSIIFEKKFNVFETRKQYIEKELDSKEFQELEIKYQQNLLIFNDKNKKLELEYIDKLNEYNMLIDSNRKTIKERIYQRALIPNLPASRGPVSTKRGFTELQFLKILDEELKGIIFADMVPSINLQKKANVYNPDFTLICNKTNLHIDIEIDEPYSMFEKTPIHYIGCPDDQRNYFFLENNWCVIRFSEKQIITNPSECLKTIKSVYNSIIEMNEHYTTNLKFDSRWTYEESLIMQKNRYREIYLS
ncbi:hypothetical protein [Telluribacter sp. SYSU D00476]|uniref:hypothetical protein n=1 Tax=Telluribacter sp. SYSU D00476 TaxID=2811430 RepID=UPI001FF32BC9|nr:hypothetical protein [Telluribacter sp. SYSU D00476]